MARSLFRITEQLTPRVFTELTRIFAAACQRCHREFEPDPGQIDIADSVSQRVRRFHFDTSWESLRYTNYRRIVLVGQAELDNGRRVDAELFSVPGVLELRSRLGALN